MIDVFPHRSKRGVKKKANYPNIRDKGRCFQCWKNVFLAKALNQRTESDWTEFMSFASCIEQAVTDYALLIKLMLSLVSVMLQIE